MLRGDELVAKLIHQVEYQRDPFDKLLYVRRIERCSDKQVLDGINNISELSRKMAMRDIVGVD